MSINYIGWVGGRAGWWQEQLELRLNSASVEVEVRAELGKIPNLPNFSFAESQGWQLDRNQCTEFKQNKHNMCASDSNFKLFPEFQKHQEHQGHQEQLEQQRQNGR